MVARRRGGRHNSKNWILGKLVHKTEQRPDRGRKPKDTSPKKPVWTSLRLLMSMRAIRVLHVHGLANISNAGGVDLNHICMVLNGCYLVAGSSGNSFL